MALSSHANFNYFFNLYIIHNYVTFLNKKFRVLEFKIMNFDEVFKLWIMNYDVITNIVRNDEICY